MIDILWHDDTAVAVNKPCGLLVHNSHFAGPKEHSLRQILGEQLDWRLYPVHRLDRPTSGVLLFTVEREFARPWHEQLGGETSKKYYLALVRGHLGAPVLIDHPIREGEKSREARSLVTPLLQSPVERCSLVQVRLDTGRKHQARRHLGHISHPVIGDTTHGKGAINRFYRAEYELCRLALHAWRLHIDHPLTGERLHVRAPLPADLALPLARLFPDSDLSTFLEQPVSL